MTLTNLITYFKENDYSNKSIVIRVNEKICNVKKTTDSLILILENRSNDGCYKAYENTLREIFLQVNNKN